MAESGLSLGYADFCTETGYYLGYGRDSIAAPTKWSADEQTDIDRVVQDGYRQFLAAQGGERPHEWSFLRIITSLDTAAGTYNQTLPDNCGGDIGDELYFDVTESYSAPARKVSVETILEFRSGQSTAATGAPKFFATRMLTGAAGATGQRYEVIFYPTPDAIYTMHFRHTILSANLTVAAPYPLGGMRHGATIQASCLAVAELRMNDEKGPRWADYVRQLEGSVRVDERTPGRLWLGYVGGNRRADLWPRAIPPQTTYNGSTYP